MAFEHNSERTKNIKQALKKDDNLTPAPVKEDNTDTASTQDLSKKVKSLMKGKKPKETKKAFTFTLDPSIKLKADKMAKSTNYPSTSSFLNDLIKNL
ncbi:hypothetical protein [Macrococcus animalis]|uniref:hypothetical protein n=1 Tax=Macrococcus animalis TaxID=3395467 RepID=UPI0039BDFF3E